MQDDDSDLSSTQRPVGTLLFVSLCLFVGFWGFVYDGYSEDAGSGSADTASIGIIALVAAGVSILRAIRRTPPGKRARTTAATVLLAPALAGLAVFAVYVYVGNQ